MDEIRISKFNMAQATLERLNESIKKAFTYYQAGNIPKWYFELKGLKMQIIGKLSSDEREELKQLEKIIQMYIMSPKHFMKVSILIENYNEKLQDLMEQKGLLLIDKEDESVFA